MVTGGNAFACVTDADVQMIIRLLHGDGDVAGVIATTNPETAVDIYMGSDDVGQTIESWFQVKGFRFLEVDL